MPSVPYAEARIRSSSRAAPGECARRESQLPTVAAEPVDSGEQRRADAPGENLNALQEDGWILRNARRRAEVPGENLNGSM